MGDVTASPRNAKGRKGDQGRPDRRQHDGAGETSGEITLDRIFGALAANPDLDALRAAHPSLTDEHLRSAFATAATLVQQAGQVRFRKGATRAVITRTHGLPEPDPSIHKGNVFRALLGLFTPGRLLDLGAGKGNFSLSAAQLGWQVTAVDARTVRWPEEATADAETAALIQAIRWVQADVREFPIGAGDYDLVCVLGLLHHLEVADQIALLTRCAAMPTLLDTRIAKTNIDRIDGYEGMLIREHGDTREERDAVPQASWGNPLSFQHTEESLLRLVMACGYVKMFQMRPPHRPDYTFYLLLPATSPRQRPQDRAERKAQREERRARRAAGAAGVPTGGTEQDQSSEGRPPSA